MKIGLHCHTAGRSPCACVQPERIAELYRQAGFDGLMVTDHFISYLFEDYYPEGSEECKVDFWLDGYRRVKAAGEKLGLCVMLGMELNLAPYNEPGIGYPVCEFLCCGLTEDFILAHPRLYELRQEECFELLDGNGILMYQAHPFRGRSRPGSPLFLHGAEVFNANVRHQSHNALAECWVKEFGLIPLAGDDFHQEGDQGRAWIETQRKVASAPELAEEIRAGRYEIGLPEALLSRPRKTVCLTVNREEEHEP